MDSPPKGGETPFPGAAWILPAVVVAVAVLIWHQLSASGRLPDIMFPSPARVITAFEEEISSGRMVRDVFASLLRVGAGFTLAVVLGIPLGLAMGHLTIVRLSLLPVVNFFRCLSPLAWIPFAVFWFGVGHESPIFLIFLASFFPLVLTTMAAVAGIPLVHFRVARDFDIRGPELLWKVTLPAIAPETITGLRVSAGMAWVVVVAAEMLAGRNGLGFAIMDARNGLRSDLLVVEMITIGIIGVVLDRLITQLTRIPSVRWGYER